MIHYTPYEHRARKEISDWRSERDGALTRTLKKVGAVVKPAADLAVAVVPNPVKRTIGEAVLGALEAMKDAAYWTYRDSEVLRVAATEGATAQTVADLANEDLETLDRSARRFFGENKVAAMLEGAGCGLGGWAFVAADVPVLFTLAFRAVQQIGASYGFDMRDPDMVHVVMRVFTAGSATAPEIKAAALFDMHVAAIALSKNWTYKRVAERTKTGVMVQALKEATKRMPREISKHVTQKKLAQGIPLIGAGVGGFFNYRFLSNTCRSAHMLFRELYLARKYGGDDVEDAEFELVPAA